MKSLKKLEFENYFQSLKKLEHEKPKKVGT